MVYLNICSNVQNRSVVDSLNVLNHLQLSLIFLTKKNCLNWRLLQNNNFNYVRPFIEQHSICLGIIGQSRHVGHRTEKSKFYTARWIMQIVELIAKQ